MLARPRKFKFKHNHTVNLTLCQGGQRLHIKEQRSATFLDCFAFFYVPANVILLSLISPVNIPCFPYVQSNKPRDKNTSGEIASYNAE